MHAGSLLQTTLDLTEAQIQDLLYLRRLFCGKVGQLARARKALMSRLPSETIGICHASDKLEEVTNLAEQLRANGSEEYRTSMQFANSFYRGVSTWYACAMAATGFPLFCSWVCKDLPYLQQGKGSCLQRTTIEVDSVSADYPGNARVS